MPDPARFGADDRRIEHRPASNGAAHTVTSRHDPSARRARPIHIVHTLTDPHGHSADELDAMAAMAGLSPAGRWSDWTGSPADAHSRDPISLYVR